MAVCKHCGKDRKLTLYNPYYGVLSPKGKRRIKVCTTCAKILKSHTTKRFTDVLQSDLWSRDIDDSIDAALFPLRRVNYMIRYGGEVMANPESLAEHSYTVVNLSIQIVKRFGLGVDFERLVTIATYHDTAEIMIGDIPTPLKTGKVKKENEELEERAYKIFDQWGIHIPEYDPMNKDDVESRVVKCADYLSAIVYCGEEVYIGSNNLKDALTRSLKKFTRYVYHDWERSLLERAIDFVEAVGEL